jgi:hypothetical protein
MGTTRERRRRQLEHRHAESMIRRRTDPPTPPGSGAPSPRRPVGPSGSGSSMISEAHREHRYLRLHADGHSVDTTTWRAEEPQLRQRRYRRNLVFMIVFGIILALAFVVVLNQAQQDQQQQQQQQQHASALSRWLQKELHLPPILTKIFSDTSTSTDVPEPVLVAVADTESNFGRDPGAQTVNASGCVGFMQIGVTGACGDTWNETVTLDGPDGKKRTIVVKDAYTLGTRPASYPGESATHPNPNDPFDAVMAAAVILRAKIGGAPITDLGKAAYDAVEAYNGTGAAAVAYANTVMGHARSWQQAADASEASTTTGPLSSSPSLERIITVADQIAAAQYGYCMGGGHTFPLAKPSHGTYCHAANNTFISGDAYDGLDCSGAVSMLFQQAGYNIPTMDSAGFASLGEPGIDPSGELTIWANPGSGADGHVFVEIAGEDWGTSNSIAYGGPHWGSQTTENMTPRHLPGI